MRSLRSYMTALSLATFLCPLFESTACRAEQKNPPETGGINENAKPPKPAQHGAYLGLFVAEIHPAVASHLPGLAFTGQGVIVQRVNPDSPAAAGGIREHDILLTYDDQKLFCHEQLVVRLPRFK